MATSWTQSDLDALEKAIKSGARSVSYGNGNRVDYGSLADMMQLRATMAAEIQDAPTSQAIFAGRVS